MSSSSAQHGFSLIETVIFIVIVGIAVATIGSQFVTNVRSSHEPLLRQRALAVGNAYLDEIVRKKWNHNTPAGGGCVTTGSGNCTTPGAPAAAPIGNDGQGRAAFDDVDDYNGLNEVPTDSEGNAMPGYARFTVTVAVTQPGGAWNGISASDVRQIDVTVTATDNQNESLLLTAYRVNF